MFTFKQPSVIVAALAVLVLAACQKSDDATPQGAYAEGLWVVNEGAFQNGTGTLSFLRNGTTLTAENDVFNTVNKRPLGNIAQSATIFNDKIYIVINNAKKVEVAAATDLREVATITGLEMPRYFLGISSNQAYISQWGLAGVNGSIQVVNLQTNTVTQTIPTGKGAEQMVKVGDKVYVACSGGFDKDNKVQVIDTKTNTVSASITVADNPSSLQLDANGKLWVLCSGASDWTNPRNNTSAALIRLNTSTNAIEQRFNFATNGAANLTINGAKNTLYYTFGGRVFAQNISAATLNTTPAINRGFYALGYDTKREQLYAADAKNFVSNGWVLRYNPNTMQAADSVQVGIIPTYFLPTN